MTDDAENLRKFLESKDPAMRRMGLSMAKGNGVPEELHLTLLGILLWDSEEGNREAAKDLVDGIGIKNIPESRGWLESLDNLDRGVRCAAVAALGKSGDARAVKPLIHALEDEEIWVRWRAARALGEIGDARAVEPLNKVLKDEEEYVCDYAARALGEIGDERAVEPLINALEEANWDASHAPGVAHALGEIGDARAVEPLIEALRHVTPHSDLRGEAADALGKIGDERAVEPLIEALGDDDFGQLRYVRQGAARALGKIGDAHAVEPLIKALADEDKDVRSYAAEALKAIGGPRAMEAIALRIETLIEALVNDDEDISNHALVPLIGIGEPAVESLIEWAGYLLNGGPYGDYSPCPYYTDEGWGLWQIANALEGIGDARAVEVLIKIMSDGYACDGAVDALISIGKPAVEPLIKALGDEDDDVRQAAKEALRKLGHEEAAANDLHPLHNFFEVEVE